MNSKKIELKLRKVDVDKVIKVLSTFDVEVYSMEKGVFVWRKGSNYQQIAIYTETDFIHVITDVREEDDCFIYEILDELIRVFGGKYRNKNMVFYEDHTIRDMAEIIEITFSDECPLDDIKIRIVSNGTLIEEHLGHQFCDIGIIVGGDINECDYHLALNEYNTTNLLNEEYQQILKLIEEKMQDSEWEDICEVCREEEENEWLEIDAF